MADLMNLNVEKSIEAGKLKFNPGMIGKIENILRYAFGVFAVSVGCTFLYLRFTLDRTEGTALLYFAFGGIIFGTLSIISKAREFNLHEISSLYNNDESMQMIVNYAERNGFGLLMVYNDRIIFTEDESLVENGPFKTYFIFLSDKEKNIYYVCLKDRNHFISIGAGSSIKKQIAYLLSHTEHRILKKN